MAKRISACLAGHEWTTVRREVRRFLETWSFSISETGLVYVRPLAKRLTARALNLFLRRLLLICDEGFPNLVVFDLAGAAISGKVWSRMQRNLDRFAARIDASLLNGSKEASHSYYALIWRSQALCRMLHNIRRDDNFTESGPAMGEALREFSIPPAASADSGFHIDAEAHGLDESCSLQGSVITSI